MDNSIDIKQIEALPDYFSDSSVIKGISADKLKDIGQRALDRLNELKEVRRNSNYEEERQKDFDAYHLVAPKKPLPYAGYPNLACPLARIGVDTFHANAMFTFAGQDGVFKVLPDFLSKSHMDSATRAAEYMTYVLNYEADLYNALDQADMDANKYENGYLKARYITKQEWETRVITEETITPGDPDPVTGVVPRVTKKSKRKERIKKTVFDGVRVERLDPAMVYASPFYSTVEEAVEKDYFFEVANYNMRFVKEMAVSFDKEMPPFFTPSAVDKIKDARRSSIISRMERNKQQYDGIQVDKEVELSPIELATAYCREDINGDGLAEPVTIIFEATTGIVLRMTFGKCRIVKLCPRPVDGRWAGESIRKAIYTLMVEWEAIHNQRVAKGQWSNLPFFFYKQGGRFNPQMITLMPGKGYPVDDPGSIQFPAPPPPDASYFNEERLLMDLVDRILATGDVIQGVSKGTDTTATNTMQSVQRAGIRLSNPINRLCGSLEKLMEHIWELNKQCAPEVKEYRVVGVGTGTPVFSKIESSDYEAMVSFKLNMATMYDVQMLRDTALLNYKTFISNPIVMSNPATFYQLTQETMAAVGLKIKLPVPDQAKAKSPFEVIDLIHAGEEAEPTVGIDPDEHMKALMAFMKSDDYEEWLPDRQQALLVYYDKCQILKKTLESANLNQSGVFQGMNGMQAPAMPSMDATRNPSAMMNRMRVGESKPSQIQNLGNGVTGAAAPQPNQGGPAGGM